MSEHDDTHDSLSDMEFDQWLARQPGDLLRRISADGAVWRRSLPTTDRLAGYARSLGDPPGGAPRANHHAREDRTMALDNAPTDPGAGPPVPPTPTRGARFHRARQVIAAVAALLVVALFASVFAAQSRHRGPGAGQATPTATASATPTPTPLPPGAQLVAAPRLSDLSGMPVFSTSNPHTVYVVNGARITRSDDDGAHWTTLPLPNNLPSGLVVAWVDLFVSPLDARTVYATANLTNPDNSQVTNCPAPLPMAHIGAKIARSGVVPCDVTEVSADGGATWGIVRLSGGLELGSASLAASELGQYDAYSASPVVQGHYIYTLAGYGPLASVAPDRLLNSGDGGMTWGFSDTSLLAQGQAPCQYAATSTGTTLFAVTTPSTTFCDPAYGEPTEFWRSDDLGSTWRPETAPPGRAPLGLTISSGAQPILYLMAPAAAQPHVGVSGATDADIFASADGGATWTRAPSAGVSATAGTAPSAMTTLSDGTLVVAFDDAPIISLYTWRPGQGSWTKLAQIDNGRAPAALVNIPASGHDALWLTVASGNTPQTATYTVYTGALK